MTLQDLMCRAGSGDLSALRDLRDQLLNLADDGALRTTELCAEALSQAELIAQLAVANSAHPMDYLGLVLVYQVRLDRLSFDLEGCEALGKEAAEAGRTEDAARWAGSVAQISERLGFYRQRLEAALTSVVKNPDTSGTVALVKEFSKVADAGNDAGLRGMQAIMDNVPVHLARSILSEVSPGKKAPVQ